MFSVPLPLPLFDAYGLEDKTRVGKNRSGRTTGNGRKRKSHKTNQFRLYMVHANILQRTNSCKFCTPFLHCFYIPPMSKFLRQRNPRTFNRLFFILMYVRICKRVFCSAIRL